MMNLPPPSLDHKAVYEAARSRFQDEDYKGRLAKGQPDVLSCGEDYVAKATAGLLHTIAKSPGVPPSILPGDMQNLYKQGLLRKNSEARRYYERMRLSSPFRVCPFCLHRTVKTLDHFFLPKNHYAPYTVLPSNLLPCCRDCNSDKERFSAVDRASTLIHPYFDDIDSTPWLGCELSKTPGRCSPTFYIKQSSTRPELFDRLLSHMEVLELFDLYDIEGSRELNDMLGTLRDTLASAGVNGVKSLCESMARSRSALANNYWRAVLWRAAANDNDFCSLGWAN